MQLTFDLDLAEIVERSRKERVSLADWIDLLASEFGRDEFIQEVKETYELLTYSEWNDAENDKRYELWDHNYSRSQNMRA